MNQYSYALIDGVMRQTAIKDIYTFKEAVQLIPLYTGTRFQDNYDLGPILVSVLENSSLINQVQQADWLESTTILHSNQPPAKVAEHLRQFITVTDETGSNVLFRFADPLITWHWLNSYPENALIDILGPIDKWCVTKPYYLWQTTSANERQQFIPNKTLKATGLTLNYLTEPQTKALDKAADFRFKNEQYLLLIQKVNNPFQDKTEQQITDWLDRAVAEAEVNNLQTERAIAIWLDLTADLGDDFLIQPEGVYQTWLANNLQNKSLPLEVNLENFYRQLHNI